MLNLIDTLTTISDNNLQHLLNSQIIICDHTCDDFAYLNIYEFDDFWFDAVPEWLDVEDLNLPMEYDDYSIIFGHDSEGTYIILGIDESGNIWDSEYTATFADNCGIRYYNDTNVLSLTETDIDFILDWQRNGCDYYNIPYPFNTNQYSFIGFYDNDKMFVTNNIKPVDTSNIENILKDIINQNNIILSGNILDDFDTIINYSAEIYNKLMQQAAELGSEIPFNDADDDIISYLNTNPLLPRLWGVFSKIYSNLTYGE